MTNDARLSFGLPNHPKTKKLIRRLGAEGAWYLVRLILWTASTHSDGDLSGMSDEDIELAIDWPNEAGTLVAALLEVGFLDGAQGDLRFHGWEEHNPWVFGQGLRSAKARWNAIKRHHGEAEANRRVPGFTSTAGGNATSNAGSTKVAMRLVTGSNAPSPLPSPYPLSPAMQTAAIRKLEDDLFMVANDFKLGRLTAEERDIKIAAIQQEMSALNSKAALA